TFRILFVCTGNTCRSPMAGALARVMLAKKLGCPESELPSHGIEVSSAGTAGGAGRAADHAVAVMRHRKIDLSHHVSSGLTAEMIDRADEILVMTRSHRQSVLAMVSSAEDRVRLVLGDRDLDDPIGGSEEDYERCATALTEGISARLDEVII
ncbi:MAG: translation factor, partial [Planctomycetes bacterium]|nr:translation factor [Planctomycetota bacterium]